MNQKLAKVLYSAAGLAAVAFTPLARAADPWADIVVNYTAGTGAPAGYQDPSFALGKPTLFTSPQNFGSAVTPFAGSWAVGETVSLGAGGSLTLQFAEPVTNDPLNPFGLDLIVFGNAFYSTNVSGLVIGGFNEGGSVAVSANGVDFFNVSGEADGLLFPANAYVDITDPFATTPGLIEADFTRPVNPAFDPLGKTFAQIIAGYEGSGGGLGIDIAPTGLSSISYVRISNPIGATASPEIDAIADVASVPEPASLQLFFAAALILLGKSARTSNVNAVTRVL
jgi:hypothetical protein